MPNWVVEHTTKVFIGFLVPVVLGGVGYISWYASKVPYMEETLAKHDDKLATISTNLILLMNKSGEELDEDKIKELISQVRDIGIAKARLIRNAKVVEGSVDIPILQWVPDESKTAFKITQTTASQIKNREAIGKLISASAVTEERSMWGITGNNLIVTYPTGKVAFTPSKGTTREDLKKVAAEMNAISKALSEAKIDERATVEQKQ